MTDSVTKGRWSTLALLLIVATAFSVRLYSAAVTPVVWDEYRWIAIADQVDLRPGHVSLPIHGDQHPPGEVYFAALGSALLGHNVIGYRMSSVVMGTLAVLLMFFVGRELGGPKTGLAAAFLLAVNEYHIGVSRLATEKTYLTFAVLVVVLVPYILRRPTFSRLIALGLAFGAGMATKQSLALWLPCVALWFAVRGRLHSLWRLPGLWAGLAVMAVCVLPDVAWNVAHLASPTDHGLGLGYQASKLSIGSWSWGPLALFVRPLYIHGVGGGLSEYPSMTTAAGLLVLGSTVASLFVLRSAQARALQVLGIGTFLFVCLFTTPISEFWWADMVLVPFIALTAGVAATIKGRWSIAPILAGCLLLLPASAVVSTQDNYYPLDWGAPTPRRISTYKTSQRLLMVVFSDRDHLELCSLGSLRLPVCRFYAESLEIYQRHLAGLAGERERTEPLSDSPRAFPSVLERNIEPVLYGPDGWPEVPVAMVPQELAWAQAEANRFGAIDR